jgi:type IV pilus assembly protein PilN
MIKVNLLEGTAEQRVASQKTRQAARLGQILFMFSAALLIFAIAMGVDWLWTNNAAAAAKVELEREQEEAKKLEADVARKNELENELKQVEERIKVIKQLRAEQKGPVGMLSSINERLPGGTADFKLTSIVQKGNRLTIIGDATNQQIVSDFMHRLEFSGGMFTGLFVSVLGADDKDTAASPEPAAAQKAGAPATKKSEPDEMGRTFHFKIDCDYNKPHDPGSDDSSAAPKRAALQTK